MADKNKLTSSFGSSRKRKKPSLDEIDKIAEGVSGTPSTTPAAPKPAPAKKKASAPRKPAVSKKPVASVKPPPAAEEAVPMKKTSVDLPLALYQEIKILLIKDQMKFREYLTNLIEQDLKKRR